MMRFLVIACLTLFTLTSCRTVPTDSSMVGQAAPVVDGQTNLVTTGSLDDFQPIERQIPVTTRQAGTHAGISTQALSDRTNPLSTRSIFFDFDIYTVSRQYIPVIEAHARFLFDHPEALMMIQGNTDSRGTREYNLVLGQRRADAVRDLLVMMGAREHQIETVSFGKENLRTQGNSDSDHAQNRRSDILYRYQDRQEF